VHAEHVLFGCLIAFVAIFAAVAVSNTAFFLRLKRYEHDVWLSLGSPMPTLDRAKGMHQFTAVRAFLKRKEHHLLRDLRSASLGDLVVFTDRGFLVITFLVSAIAGYIVLFVKP